MKSLCYGLIQSVVLSGLVLCFLNNSEIIMLTFLILFCYIISLLGYGAYA